MKCSVWTLCSILTKPPMKRILETGQAGYKLSIRYYKRIIVNYVRCDNNITITYKAEISSQVHTEEFYNLVKNRRRNR